MASMMDTFKEAAKSAAKGAADTLFAPKEASPAVVPAASSGIFTPTASGLPSWALPAAAVAAVVLLSRR